MAENLTIARPYAKACFESALEHNTFDKWQEMLYALTVAISDERVYECIKNSSSAQSSSDTLIELLDDYLDELGQNFVRVLGENNRYFCIPEIYAEFVRLRAEHDKVKEATLITARDVDYSYIKAMKTKLENKYNCTIDLRTSIDPSIIGGAILQIGDEIIDASVKTSIQNLSSTLK